MGPADCRTRGRARYRVAERDEVASPMSAAPHRRSHAEGWRATAALVIAAAGYFGVRKLAEGSSDGATRNADRLLRFEQALGIDVEHSIQRFVLDHPVLVDWSNHIYVWLHWPFLIF